VLKISKTILVNFSLKVYKHNWFLKNFLLKRGRFINFYLNCDANRAKLFHLVAISWSLAFPFSVGHYE